MVCGGASGRKAGDIRVLEAEERIVYGIESVQGLHVRGRHSSVHLPHQVHRLSATTFDRERHVFDLPPLLEVRNARLQRGDDELGVSEQRLVVPDEVVAVLADAAELVLRHPVPVERPAGRPLVQHVAHELGERHVVAFHRRPEVARPVPPRYTHRQVVEEFRRKAASQGAPPKIAPFPGGI